MNRTVLVTGAAGYIGSVLVRQLLAQGFSVRGVDSLLFGGESLLGLLDHDGFEFRKTDIRDGSAMKSALQDSWAVVHLAAIVGDPACRRQPELARSVNLEASLDLYRASQIAGVERFVFASTCSNYGKLPDPNALADERSELRPVSLYAETKVEVERYLLNRQYERATKPTCLRFATVFGLSPRMRFDLTVNEFTRQVVTNRELVVFGEQFWRPYCHVRDLARSAVQVLRAPSDKVAFEVFNVGDTGENYRKADIVDAILDEIPNARVRYVKKDEDPRDYRVRFEKIKDVLGFGITRTVRDGIREVKQAIEDGILPRPFAAQYANVPEANESMPFA